MADQVKKTEEISKNCPSCNKPLKKARRFYRNGKYFCNSNCFKKADAKAKEEKAAAEAAAQQASETKA